MTCWKQIMQKKAQYFVMAPNDNNTVLSVTVVGERGHSLRSLVKQLTDKDPCYFIYDMKVKMGDGTHRDKIIFINYNPDNCTNVERKFFMA